jgi:hypothetical protein
VATVPDQRDRSLTGGRAAILVVAAGLAGIATACALAPEYLAARGLPLDDAWVHAVYARSLARSGMLAFNPGVPGTGVTSPLWTAVISVPHLVTSRVPAVLLGIKLLGLTLHLLAALVLLRAFSWRGRVGLPALAGCVLAAFHPDLVSAGMSGVETALATLTASGLLLAVGGSGTIAYGLLSFAAPLVRPELTILSFAMPVALLFGRDRRRLAILSGVAGVGTALAYGIIGARNLAASGRPLVAGVYAQAGAGDLGGFDAEVIGFSEVLGRLPVVDSSVLLLTGALLAVYVVVAQGQAAPALRRAAVAMLAGLLFCALSFVVTPPIDPTTFSQQRHVLPVLPLMVAALPILVFGVLEPLLPARAGRLVRVALLGLLMLSVLVVARFRYTTLASDARSADDAQVEIARHLASLEPDQVVWAVDPGALRYLGRAFVVDLVGPNNVRALGGEAQRFLDEHRPSYIETAPQWSSLDSVTSRALPALRFPRTSDGTPGVPAPGERWLVECPDPAISGQIAIRERVFEFRCARR